jgi:hypothetical protein
VYVLDRLQKRQLGLIGDREACSPPTPEQLTRIRAFLQAISSSVTDDEDALLNQLQKLATQIRQYRLYRRNGILPTEPIDQPGTPEPAKDQSEAEDNTEEEQEFLRLFRQQIVRNLDDVLRQVTTDRAAYLQRRKPSGTQPFLIALQLFHCRELSMGKIAPLIGLNAQYQVSRLLKLKEFRAAVKSLLFSRLRDWLVDKASAYTDPTHLQELIQEIEGILAEEVSNLFQDLFAYRLCHYLDTLDLDTLD